MGVSRRRILVCAQCRCPAGRDDCGAQNGVAAALEQRARELGVESAVAIKRVACFAVCGYGVNLHVEPDGIWYGAMTAADAPALIDEHLVGGRPLERFRVPPPDSDDDSWW